MLKNKNGVRWAKVHLFWSFHVPIDIGLKIVVSFMLGLG